MFYSVLALLVTKKKGTSKHGRVIGLFDLEYVKSGIFPKEFSKWLHRAFDLRQRCDYEPLFSVSQDDAKAIIDAATEFVAETKTVLGDILDHS